MKTIRIGDPHCTVNNIKDCEKIIDFAIEKAIENNASAIEFMGDLFHTHAILRVEVLHFWKRSFKKITSKGLSVLSLVGNHDMQNPKNINSIHALLTLGVLDKNITIVDKPMVINNIGYLPYYDSNEEFIKQANTLYDLGATNTLVCHQTFDGAVFENGFYAPNGVNPKEVKQKHIISGHIHVKLDFNKVSYLGTPKWDTISDANAEKGIWLFEHTDNGKIYKRNFFSTKEIVQPICKVTIKEEDEKLPNIDKNSRNYIELIGKNAWIKKMKNKYKSIARIKAIATDKRIALSSSSKVHHINDFLSTHFSPINGVKKQDILDYMRELQ